MADNIELEFSFEMGEAYKQREETARAFCSKYGFEYIKNNNNFVWLIMNNKEFMVSWYAIARHVLVDDKMGV